MINLDFVDPVDIVMECRPVLYKDRYFLIHGKFNRLYEKLTHESKAISLEECLSEIQDLSEYIREMKLENNRYKKVINDRVIVKA